MTKSRRHRRVRFTELVQFYVGTELIESHALNLSLGGVALSCSRVIPRDATVRLYLPLRGRTRKDSRFTAVSGRAVWQNMQGIGVEFDDVPTETLEQLARFVSVRAIDMGIQPARDSL